MLLEKLTKPEVEQLLSRVTAELAKIKIVNRIELPTKILLEKRVPITSSLTEHEFIASIDEIDFATALARTTFVSALKRPTRPTR